MNVLLPIKRSLERLPKDLGAQIFLLYLLFVIPIVSGAFIFDYFASQRLRAEIMSADLSLAQAIAQETNTTIQNALQAVRQMAEYEAVMSADVDGMNALFENMQGVRPDVNLIYRLGADGIMVFHYPVAPGSTLGVDFSFRDYFLKAKETREPLISLGRISPTTQEPVATAVMPLWRGGQFLGLVATNIKLQSLSNTLAGITEEHDREENFQVTMVDASGKVIAHPDATLLLTDLNEVLPTVISTVLNGQSGNQIVENAEMGDILYSYVPVNAAGWGVVVSRPAAVAFSTPLSLHRGVILMSVVFLGIGLFFWAALSWRVISPLERLAEYSQAIGSSHAGDKESQRGFDELSSRQDQLGYLVRSILHMEQTLQARFYELSTLLDTSAAVVSSLDSQTVLDRILEQVEKLTDVEMCAIVGKDEDSQRFRAKASRGLSDRYQQKLVIDPDEYSSLTLKAIRAGKPLQISDIEKAPEYPAIQARAREEGYRAMMAIPLNSQHAPPSALLVYRRQAHVFTEHEIDLLANFANHAAMAIENAALYARSDARLKRQTQRLEALIQSLEDGLLLEDWQGKVLYGNRRVAELAGVDESEIPSQHIETLLARVLANALDKEKTLEAISHSLENGHQSPIDIALNTKTGMRYLRLKFFDVTDAAGISIGRGQILQDVTRRHELDRMKSSLIATVSHELRTPLAAIKGYATTLLAEDVRWDANSQNEFLNIISNEVDRLGNLVSNLLDMSRIEAGNLTIAREACDLRALATRASMQTHPSATGRVQIEMPLDLPTVYADPQRIEAVLRNLIENAIKYTGDDSPIRVSAEVNTDQVIVRVHDEGTGVAAEDREHIFDSFYRGESDLSRKVPGAGLGLSICQGFVRAHGGDIWIETSNEGFCTEGFCTEGFCMAFSLPLAYQQVGLPALEGSGFGENGRNL